MSDYDEQELDGHLRQQKHNITLQGHEFKPLDVARPRYGNMKVITQSPCLVTLGPDYWCFLPTFITFSIISFFIIKLVFTHNNNFYFQAATLIICGGMCVSYFAVATSNPGIVLEENYADTDQQQGPITEGGSERKRLCRKCNIRVKRGTYHCRDCDVCIEGYDHHCPWTSKCIGSGNIIRFYIFLGFVPIYLVYVFVAFAAVMSDAALASARVHVRHG